MKHLSFGLALALLAPGCGMAAYFAQGTPTPMQALEVRMDPHERRECLVVFMPGMSDGPDTFRAQGFLRDASRASSRCDLVAPNAHLGYYYDHTVRERLSRDILMVAESRGYEEIWMVGVSMGGLGSLLVAQENPGRIAGVVLLGPYLGGEELVADVAEAGLAEWEGPDDADPNDPDEYDDALWVWLQGYATHPAQMPQLFVGLGTDDPRPAARALGAVLPPERRGTAVGGHAWTTWRVLFRRLLESPPWDPRSEVPRIAIRER